MKGIETGSLEAENKCLGEILSLLEPSIVMRCQSVASDVHCSISWISTFLKVIGARSSGTENSVWTRFFLFLSQVWYVVSFCSLRYPLHYMLELYFLEGDRS